MRCLALLRILGFLMIMNAVMPLASQTPTLKAAFEVASIKPNNSDSLALRTFSGPDGSLRATNTNVRGLIRTSYGVFDFQIVGGPDWINTARFDVEGRAKSGLADPDVLAIRTAASARDAKRSARSSRISSSAATTTRRRDWRPRTCIT